MKRFFLVIVAAITFGACGPTEENTPLIHVNPNAAKRGAWIHGLDTADAGAPKISAHVHSMRAGEELGGPNATGRPGDLVLENDEVAFVIDQLGAGAGFGVSGGNLIDAADAKSRKDEIGQVITYFGAFPRQGVYETIDAGVLADGTAFVESRGHELIESKLAIKTRYTLHANDRALLIETTLDNRGDQTITLPGIGDAIQWGGAEKFAPDRGRGFKGPSSGAFLGAVGRYASYAITSTDGAIAADNGPSWSDTLQARRTEIPAGKSVHYARVFLVGPRADVAGIVSELTKSAGGAVGSVRVDLVESAKAVTPSADASIEVGVGGKAIMDLRPDATGALVGELPLGRYTLRYGGGGGRGATGAPQTIEVLANQEARATLEVTAPGRLHARCMERVSEKVDASPVPCKATFEGLPGAAGAASNPDFGPAHTAGPARNQVTTMDGVIDVPLAPAKYRVTLSRGPEYALSQFEVDVRAGVAVEPCNVGEHCLLRRVVDTKGYLACDFHQHTMLGVDAPTSTRDRVIGNVAEGVEVAVASEHNIVADLEPLVREMGLADRLVEIAGNELTTDTSKKPWGHANVFPIVLDATLAAGGATNVRDRAPKEIFDEIRTKNPTAIFQVNHPRSGGNGYFDLLGFDRASGVGTDARYDARFDAVEVWNGRNVAQRNAVLEDVMALLRTSHPTTITGTTDTHGMVGQEAGYPRTYVRMKDDDLGAWSPARTNEMIHTLRDTRDVVVTNGPMLRVTANGAGIGAIARARGGHVIVNVTIESAPWIEVKHVKILRASSDAKDVDVTPLKNATGALVAKTTFDLAVDRDDAFIVIASGDKTLAPVLPGDGAEIRPYAMSGAIWIDADGDGKSLAR